MKKLHLKVLITLLCCLAFSPSVHAYSGPDVEISIPIYGNWCGPGYGGSDYYNPQPIDDLDQACMYHDMCYIENGYFNSACDKALLSYIENNKANMTSRQKFYANLIYATFSLAKLRA